MSKFSANRMSMNLLGSRATKTYNKTIPQRLDRCLAIERAWNYGWASFVLRRAIYRTIHQFKCLFSFMNCSMFIHCLELVRVLDIHTHMHSHRQKEILRRALNHVEHMCLYYHWNEHFFPQTQWGSSVERNRQISARSNYL